MQKSLEQVKNKREELLHVEKSFCLRSRHVLSHRSLRPNGRSEGRNAGLSCPGYGHRSKEELQPEAAPVQEAPYLRDDLRRAGIEPFGWVVNQALSGLDLSDRILLGRQAQEPPLLEKVKKEMERCWLVPWLVDPVIEILGRP